MERGPFWEDTEPVLRGLSTTLPHLSPAAFAGQGNQVVQSRLWAIASSRSERIIAWRLWSIFSLPILPTQDADTPPDLEPTDLHLHPLRAHPAPLQGSVWPRTKYNVVCLLSTAGFPAAVMLNTQSGGGYINGGQRARPWWPVTIFGHGRLDLLLPFQPSMPRRKRTTTVQLPSGDTYAGHTDQHVCTRRFLEDKYDEALSQNRPTTLYAEKTIYHVERLQRLFEESVPVQQSRIFLAEAADMSARYCDVFDLEPVRLCRNVPRRAWKISCTGCCKPTRSRRRAPWPLTGGNWVSSTSCGLGRAWNRPWWSRSLWQVKTAFALSGGCWWSSSSLKERWPRSTVWTMSRSRSHC